MKASAIARLRPEWYMGTMPIPPLSRVATLVFVGAALCIFAVPATLGAADDAPAPRVDPDREVPDAGPGMPRGVAQILVGSAGFEPGIAAEWRWRSEPAMQVRPELSLNDNGRVGAAVSLSWGLRSSSNDRYALPGGSDIFLGPRVAFHNRDVDGWEVGAIGIYSLALDQYFRAPADRDEIARHAPPPSHFLEIIGTLGGIEHKHPDDIRFAGAVGLAFAYQF